MIWLVNTNIMVVWLNPTVVHLTLKLTQIFLQISIKCLKLITLCKWIINRTIFKWNNQIKIIINLNYYKNNLSLSVYLRVTNNRLALQMNKWQAFKVCHKSQKMKVIYQITLMKTLMMMKQMSFGVVIRKCNVHS